MTPTRRTYLWWNKEPFRERFAFRGRRVLRRFTLAAVLLCVSLCLSLTGCSSDPSKPDLVWGKHGVADGSLIMPRAAAIDKQGRLYLVDWTARIQVFDVDGKYVGPTYTTPDYRNGRPSGLSIDRDGNLIVSDSHYNCLRIYSPAGKLLRTIDGKFGGAIGELGYISDAIQDKDGYFYVAEFGEAQRITKLTNEGKFVASWGSPGSEPGQFARIRALTFGPDGSIYVADACNHRIQVFSRDGKLIRTFGTAGTGDGELNYPYDVAFSTGAEPHLYVMEYGNCRVQKFTPDGTPLGCWGGPGREPGRMYSPWALAVDPRGRVHAIDSKNHRVQRITF